MLNKDIVLHNSFPVTFLHMEHDSVHAVPPSTELRALLPVQKKNKEKLQYKTIS